MRCSNFIENDVASMGTLSDTPVRSTETIPLAVSDVNMDKLSLYLMNT